MHEKKLYTKVIIVTQFHRRISGQKHELLPSSGRFVISAISLVSHLKTAILYATFHFAEIVGKFPIIEVIWKSYVRKNHEVFPEFPCYFQMW